MIVAAFSCGVSQWRRTENQIERRGYNMSNDGCALVDLINTLKLQHKWLDLLWNTVDPLRLWGIDLVAIDGII
jgi:hypothetical protein